MLKHAEVAVGLGRAGPRQSGQAQHAVQRRAHLVTHGGEELALHRAVPLRQVERLLALVGEDGHLEAQAQHGARGRGGTPPFADDEAEEDRHRHRRVERQPRAHRQLVEDRRQQHRNAEAQAGEAPDRQHDQADRRHADHRGIHQGRSFRLAQREQQGADQPVDDAVDQQRPLVPGAPAHLVDRAVVPVAPGDAQAHERHQVLERQPAQQRGLRHDVPEQPAQQQAEGQGDPIGRARAVEQQRDLGARNARLEAGGIDGVEVGAHGGARVAGRAHRQAGCWSRILTLRRGRRPTIRR